MKFLTFLLAVLFSLIGAHVPKAFSLLYLALFATWLVAVFVDSKPLTPLPVNQLRLIRSVQVLVLIFSLTYSLAMLHFGFWALKSRDMPDLVSSVLLPNGMLWWGIYLTRRNLFLLNICLFCYSIGALIFLSFALFKTSGVNWFAPRLDPASLFMPWGVQPSMNVRSVEQNGILGIVLLPLSLYSFVCHRRRVGLLFLFISLVALLGVLPLANGRLWILSILIASWPFLCFILVESSLVFPALLGKVRHNSAFIAPILAFVCYLFWHYRSSFCDERLFLFKEAFVRWKSLFQGGRSLTYAFDLCGGAGSSILSLSNAPGARVLMLHSVPLDVLASVGLLAALPMFVFLIIATLRYLRFALYWLCRDVYKCISFQMFYIWSFIAVLLPQWLFQPLQYGDGLLYYLSYALLAVIVTINFQSFRSLSMLNDRNLSPHIS